ncbi:transketolase [Patescibacteria group bacterium]|nr:transketolase [Patescibacteria group bacterium]MBU1970622.1 transketolase [Patescibacteria group bacterium]
MPHIKSHFHAQNTHLRELAETAVGLRQDVIKMLLAAGSGHSAGSLGLADIITALYFHILEVGEDKLILSNGHTCPILYAALIKRGLMAKALAKTLRQIDSPLQGHPCLNTALGVDFTSGSLGQGLSVACGMALAGKKARKSQRIYCITGDGELNEGAVWEAAMFAPHYQLNNLTWLIDRNSIQADGYTEQIMPLEPLRDKLEAFNWYVVEINGHNIEEIISACDLAKSICERPTVIIAHTIPGKGVAEMEYKFEWHGKPPNQKVAEKALHDLRTLEGRIESEYD